MEFSVMLKWLPEAWCYTAEQNWIWCAYMLTRTFKIIVAKIELQHSEY